MIDIKISTAGDIQIGPDGDFLFVRGDEFYNQTIMFRLKTTKGDWVLAPQIGADLEQYIGTRSNELNLDAIQKTVEIEIGKIPTMPEFTVNVAPKETNSVWVLVEYASTETPERQVSLIFELDLKTGEVNARE